MDSATRTILFDIRRNNMILTQFNDKLQFILHEYRIDINQDEKEIILVTSDNLTYEKLDNIYSALAYNIESFRGIFVPEDFDFEDYINRLADIPIGYTVADLEPRRYYFHVENMYEDYNDDIKEPEEWM